MNAEVIVGLEWGMSASGRGNAKTGNVHAMDGVAIAPHGCARAVPVLVSPTTEAHFPLRAHEHGSDARHFHVPYLSGYHLRALCGIMSA